MQTFLPFPDFRESAAVLDDPRLGKQRVETLQILRALHVPDYGWSAHPAVTMWRGHTEALVAYGVAVVDEWVRRGHADSTRTQIIEFIHPIDPLSQEALAALELQPPWLGDETLHRSHRSNLRRKDPDHYGAAFPDTPPDLDYVWPDPPAPALQPGRRDAWVVRGERDGDHLVVASEPGDDPWLPLDARSGRITKRMRQIARLADEVQDGDVVIHPVDGEVLVGRIVGGYAPHGGDHRLRVTWMTSLPRTALDHPALLQDPQVVFALHDEPTIRAAAS